MFADEIRHAVEASSRITLPAVTALLWRAYGEGKVSEAEAEALSGLIAARTILPQSEVNSANSQEPLRQVHTKRDTPGDGSGRLRRPSTGSRPRTDASTERRRRWAASGRLPPALAARFTLAEQAVLALVAAETARRGDCRLAVGHLAAMVGVAETTVRNAIREARQLGLISVEERRLTGFRNDTNVVRIISPEWTAWLRLARKGVPPRHPLSRGGGYKSSKRTPIQVLEQRKSGSVGAPRRPAAPSIPTSRTASREASA